MKPIALALLALLLGWAWLTFIHDPAVRRDAQLKAEDARLDSAVAVFDSTYQVYAHARARDSLTIDSLRQARPPLPSPAPADSIVEILRPFLPESVSVLLDSLEERLARERATYALREASLKKEAQTWELAYRRADSLLTEARLHLDTALFQRDRWRRRAERRWSLGVALGPGVTQAGVEPLTLTVGIIRRF